jgi:hypothetical protein
MQLHIPKPMHGCNSPGFFFFFQKSPWRNHQGLHPKSLRSDNSCCRKKGSHIILYSGVKINHKKQLIKRINEEARPMHNTRNSHWIRTLYHTYRAYMYVRAKSSTMNNVPTICLHRSVASRYIHEYIEFSICLVKKEILLPCIYFMKKIAQHHKSM